MPEVHYNPDGSFCVFGDAGAYRDTIENACLDFGQDIPAMPEGCTEQIYTAGIRHALMVGGDVVGGGDVPWALGDALIASLAQALSAQVARQASAASEATAESPALSIKSATFLDWTERAVMVDYGTHTSLLPATDASLASVAIEKANCTVTLAKWQDEARTDLAWMVNGKLEQVQSDLIPKALGIIAAAGLTVTPFPVQPARPRIYSSTEIAAAIDSWGEVGDAAIDSLTSRQWFTLSAGGIEASHPALQALLTAAGKTVADLG